MSEPNDDATSATLLQRLRADNQDAWSRLLKLYGPLVRFWANRQGVKGADGDDAVQEVFRVVATKLPEFRRDRPGDTFRGWLRGITRFVLLRHARQSVKHPPASGGTDAQQILNALPADSTDDDPPGELNALYQRGLELVRDEFEPRTWRAFWLHVAEGREVADVAGELGLSAAAVRQAKYRVLKRLREELDGLDG